MRTAISILVAGSLSGTAHAAEPAKLCLAAAQAIDAAAARTLAQGSPGMIVEVARERYSWDGVARTVIAAARGELDGLPHP